MKVGLGLAIVLFLVLAAISWGVTCFIVWLISLCFGFEFTFLIGTGLWLILMLLDGVRVKTTTS